MNLSVFAHFLSCCPQHMLYLVVVLSKQINLLKAKVTKVSFPRVCPSVSKGVVQPFGKFMLLLVKIWTWWPHVTHVYPRVTNPFIDTITEMLLGNQQRPQEVTGPSQEHKNGTFFVLREHFPYFLMMICHSHPHPQQFFSLMEGITDLLYSFSTVISVTFHMCSQL